MAQRYGVDTYAQGAAVQSLMAGGTQLGPLSSSQQGALTQLGSNISPYQANIIAGVSQAFSISSGADYTGTAQMIGGVMSGLSPQNQQLFGMFAGGDLGAGSWMANQNGTYTNRLFDTSGNPIFETSGLDFMRMVTANSLPGPNNVPMATQAMSGIPWMSQSIQESAGQFLGTDRQSWIDAWLQGGTRGLMQQYRTESLDRSLASIGVAQAGISLQRNFLWGANQGGSWQSPAPDSIWGIQDAIEAIQHQSRLASFSFSLERMDTANTFGQRQETLSAERMAVSHDYQRWSASFNLQGFQAQREFSRDQFAYQDQMRGLNFGWQMEDMDEAIRMSTGRQRRQLVKQRDRTAISHNLEDQNIDDQRSFQERQWAREEERFKKQEEYANKIMDNEKRNFDLQVEQRQTLYDMDRSDLQRRLSEYERTHELEEKLRDKQREFTARQLDLQAASLGIQAEEIKAQKDLQGVLDKNHHVWGDIHGYLQNINKYDNARHILRAVAEAVESMDQIFPAQAERIGSAFNSMSKVRVDVASAITALFSKLNSMSAQHIRDIIDALDLDD